ncbi:hypothetical protein FM110_05215 [Brachybacterium nesterenkovii]|uniref:Uncharacterized protein n=1 Tax=Brachybacterium nesterenkovii TaxID=47847 RepID=A0A1X6WZJ7_9MICO|nr:hypothetical protein FM110_05215 [Brachybacterium nesterenkovii]
MGGREQLGGGDAGRVLLEGDRGAQGRAGGPRGRRPRWRRPARGRSGVRRRWCRMRQVRSWSSSTRRVMRPAGGRCGGPGRGVRGARLPPGTGPGGIAQERAREPFDDRA